MAIYIRSIEKKDFLHYKKIRLGMINLHPQNFDVDYVALNLRQNEEWAQDVTNSVKNNNKRRYLAFEKDICIGMIGFEIVNNEMTIGSFYVVAEYRSKGIGRKLMEECLALSKARGCRSSKLWVSTTNETATAWYKRLGFQSTAPPTIKKFDHLELHEECLVRPSV